jgi:5,10-methenyltetrahydrofolate synthetase
MAHLESKEKLRKELNQRRGFFHSETMDLLITSHAVCAISQWNSPNWAVMSYLSFKTEPNPNRFFSGTRYFPHCLPSKDLLWFSANQTQIKKDTFLNSKDHFGLRSPGVERCAPLEDLAHQFCGFFLLLPCLGVSQAGTRLGYGGGVYDRFLAKLISLNIPFHAAAVVFEANVFPQIPLDPWDIPVDSIISESGFRTALRSTAGNSRHIPK